MGRKSGTRVYVECKFCEGTKGTTTVNFETGKETFNKCPKCNGKGGRYLAATH